MSNSRPNQSRQPTPGVRLSEDTRQLALCDGTRPALCRLQHTSSDSSPSVEAIHECFQRFEPIYQRIMSQVEWQQNRLHNTIVPDYAANNQ